MAKKKQGVLIPAARIERSILLVRGQKVLVLLDMDLAELYGNARAGREAKHGASP